MPKNQFLKSANALRDRLKMQLSPSVLFRTALLAVLSVSVLPVSPVSPFGLLWAQNSEIQNNLSANRVKAEEFETREQFYSAIEAWQRLLQKNPNSSRAYWGIARSYMRLGRYKEALGFVDQAILLANRNHEIGTLKSRILMGLERYDEAKALLLRLKEDHTSHHIDLALAELFVVLGDVASGLQYLDSIKEFANKDLSFLLTSLMVYEEAGKPDVADRYLRQALDSHYNEAVVHKVAAGYYLRQGSYSKVSEEISILTRLGIDTGELRLLGLEAAYLKGDYRLAINLANVLVALHPKNTKAWYLLGLAYSKTGEPKAALEALSTARRIEPEDELVKIVIAEILRTRYPYPSKWHSQEAARYIADAKVKRSSLLYDEAMQDHRFALQIDPLNKGNWMAFANAFRDRGNYAKYLDKLYAWKKFGVSAGESGAQLEAVKPEINRLIAIYEASQRQGIAANRDIRQYDYSNNYYPLQVFVIESPDFDYVRASRELGSYFVNVLQWYEQPFVVGDVRMVKDRLQAQQAVHTVDNSDYYLVLDFTGQGESFRAEVGLYLSSTGRQIESLSIERVSKSNIYSEFSHMARRLQAMFPKKGRIIKTNLNRVIMSRGGLDGVEKGQEWVVLPESALSLSLDKPFAEYNENQVIGILTIEETDEKISEGRVALRSFVNPVKEGSITLLLPASEGLNQGLNQGSNGLNGQGAATGDEKQQELQRQRKLPQEPNNELQRRLFELS
ncbi:tetratricopeptide repeat protein [Candidatus Haliotispira prima]|uniref:Tetratricopeptide repeat protein n=1 Tax=Candidatus Haliotispira prima TaxID=3034016 RepID=A0ABY8MH53_9SPIO|nr:tetratricopeptide repeat protein [Candidatus Haliotispira prima]